MKDQLEDFIKNNRGAFDDEEPPKEAWSNIEGALGFRKKNLWNSIQLWRAAAVVFMLATGYLLVPKIQQPTTATISAPIPGVDTGGNDFRDVEDYYIRQISEKVELIDEFKRNEGLNGFTHDFQQLEAMYSVLKEDMKTRPSEKVKDALVLNLLVRIDLLNQQLHKLEKEYTVDKKKQKST